ncbi:MAG: ATP-binding protein [Rubrivivax sp.]
MAAPASLRQAAHRFRHSLKLRLLALFLLLALVLGLLLLGTLQRALQGGWQGYAQPLAADYVDRLAAEIGTPPDLARARAIAERLPVRVRIDGPVLRFDSHPGRGHDHDHGDDADGYDGPGGWGLVRTLADGHVLRFGLVAPPDGQRPRRLGWIALALLAAVTALAYLAVRRLLRPLDAIGAGVAAYTEGRFDRPIAAFAPYARGGRLRDDELGALATRIDGMAGSLASMLEAKRTLLLAISHELRSPLTRARLNAELLDDTPERAALLKDLAEMRDLVATLLESERLQQGHAALQAAPLDLAALLRELAAEGGAEADIAVAPARATLDETRVRLMLRNLLSNARRHAGGAPRPPQLFLRAEPDGRWALGLRDHGPGVADEQLARLGEPFHRPDAARTRSAGGVGLGLHLCRQVAQAHGGELRIRNARPGLELAMVWRPRGLGG